MRKAIALIFRLVLGLVVLLTGLVIGSEDGRKALGSAGTNLRQAASDTGDAFHAGASTAGATLTSDAKSVSSAVFGAHKVDEASLVPDPGRKVYSALMSHPELGMSRLKIEMNSNVLTLIGVVPTELQNQNAQKLARQVAGDQFSINDKLIVPNTEPSE